MSKLNPSQSGFRLAPTDIASAAGIYTPTLNNVTNIAASTAYICQWARTGDIITVSGQVDIDTTLAAGTASELGISLPVASDFASATQCAGTAVSVVVASMVARISADATNNRASVTFLSQNTTNDAWSFIFTYLII